MAPSRRASVQKGNQVARTPPETPGTARQSRRRSASPANQPMITRARDEPPARSTRSWISAPPVSNITPTASQRVPINCPILGCQASTVHQHLPQLQYYHPRPGRAVYYRGYGNSDYDTSSRPSLVVTLRAARQEHGDSLEGPEVAGNDELAEAEHEIEDWGVVAGEDDETATQEQLPREQEQTTAQGKSSSGEEDKVQEAAATLDSSDVDDLIHNESTSGQLQAPLTPPPSSPMAAEEGLSAQGMTGSPEEQQSAASPAPQMEYSDWLPGRGPEHNAASDLTLHVPTYDELIRPLIDPTLAPAQGLAEIAQKIQDLQSPTDPSYPWGAEEEDPDLPSLMMRSPTTEYLRQFETEANNSDAMADMLGLPNFASFGGIPVDPTPSPLLPLSSNSGTFELCNDEECPIEGEHSMGMYLHKGEMPHTFNAEFGYSDPPPEVWYAWARIEELRAGEAEIAMVNGFSKCHWWNGK